MPKKGARKKRQPAPAAWDHRRRVNPVLDLLDAQQNKAALKAALGLRAQFPAQPAVAALEALALVQAGRVAEGRAVLAAVEPSPDADALQLLTAAAKRAGVPAEVSRLCGTFHPLEAYFACGRSYDFAAQQRAAMQLYRAARDPKYLVWSAVSLLAMEDPPEPLLRLAVTMLERSAPPPASEGELHVRVELYRRLGRPADALAAVEAAPEGIRDREAHAALLEGDALRSFYRAAPDKEDWFYAGGLARRFGEVDLAPADSRAGLQARLEVEPRSVDLLARYFELHGSRESCFDDVRRFLVTLSPAERAELYERAGRPPALERLASPEPPAAELASRAAAHEAAGRTLLAAHCRLLAAPFDGRHLADAALLLERAVEAAPREPHPRLLLVRVWARLGGGAAFGRALEHYAALGVKQIQLETLTHLVLSDAARSGCAAAALRAARDVLDFHALHESENPEMTVRAYQGNNYFQALDFVQFGRRLRRSSLRALCRAEARRLEVALGPKQLAAFDEAVAAEAQRRPDAAAGDDAAEEGDGPAWVDSGDRGVFRLWEGDETPLARELNFPPVSVHAAGGPDGPPETPEARRDTALLWLALHRLLRGPGAGQATRPLVERLRGRLERLGLLEGGGADEWAAVFLAAEAAAELRDTAAQEPGDEALERWARLPRRFEVVGERFSAACRDPRAGHALATGVAPWMTLFAQRLAAALPPVRRKKHMKDAARRLATCLEPVHASAHAMVERVADAAGELARRLEERPAPRLESAAGADVSSLQAHADRHHAAARAEAVRILSSCAAAAVAADAC